jgi:Zn-dependent peptidase ImmA (M78 family)/DNA-binding XRE family transcriptional regulator
MNKVSPERITQARELLGLSKTELADRLEVTPAAVAQWESGTKSPTAENLAALAKALGVRMALLMKPRPNSVSLKGPLSFRAWSSARTRRANRKAATLAELVAEVFLWLDERITFPEVDLPLVHQEASAEEAAFRCRREWGLGDRPILKLAELLESKGIVLASAVFGDERFDAFSCIMGTRPLIFLGREKGDRARSRFDAAHELGHLLLHQHHSDSDLKVIDLHNWLETEAQSFAGAFLLPVETFSNDVIDLSLEGFLKLKPKWGVSAQAMIVRAHELEIITDSHYTELCRQISARGWRKAKQEPLDEQVPPMEPSLGKRSLELLEQNEVIHAWEVSDELPLPIEILCQVFRVEPHDFGMRSNIISLGSYVASQPRIEGDELLKEG